MSSPIAKQAMSKSLSTSTPPQPAQQVNPYINTISFGAGAASAMYGSVSGKKAKGDEVRGASFFVSLLLDERDD